MTPAGAWSEARRLGHHWVGEEHLLLALSRGAGPAANALRDAGATPARLEQAILEGLEHADPPVEPRASDSRELTPAADRLLGRAEGLALSRGAADPNADDVLVALLWHAGLASSLLHALGVDRAALATRLADAGVAVPPGQPAPLDRRVRKRIDVPYEHLMEIVAALPPLLPEGPFGFNVHHETRRAWILVGEDLDAEPLVAALLGDAD